MVTIDKERCIGCGSCISDCCMSNLMLENGKAAVRKDCILCGHCVVICPTEAVSIPEMNMTEVEPALEAAAASPEALLSQIRSARSVRHFTQRRIDREILQKLAEAGRYTATANNRQGSRFVFVQDALPEYRERVWAYLKRRLAKDRSEMSDNERVLNLFLRRHERDAQDDYFFRNAPVVLAIGGDTELDVGLAAKNIEHVAMGYGLGVMYDGYLRRLTDEDDDTRAWIGLKDKKVYCCMLLGYPAVRYRRTAPRRQADARYL